MSPDPTAPLAGAPSPRLEAWIGRHEQYARLRGSTQQVARLTLMAVSVLALAVFAGNIVILPAVLLQPSQTARSAMEQLGISPGLRAAYSMGLDGALALVCFAVALVLARYRSDHLPALLAATALVAFAGSGGTLVALHQVDARWYLPEAILEFTARTAFIAFAYVFPDGRFIPSWTRSLTLIWAVLGVFIVLPAGVSVSAATWPPLLGLCMELLAIGSLVYAQVYRYRRVSDARQREQTRWVVLGIVILLVVRFVIEAPGYVIPSLRVPGPAKLLYDMAFLTLMDGGGGGGHRAGPQLGGLSLGFFVPSNALSLPARPVLYCLRNMRRPNALLPRQIRDRPRKLQDAVVGASAELHLAHRRAQELPRGLVDREIVLDLRRSRILVQVRWRCP